MLALDLFNTKYERDLLEGGVDDLEARRIDTLNDRMQDLLARAREPAYQANPVALAILKKQFQQVKDERDSYYKVREAGIPGNVPTEKIPGKEDLLKGRGRTYYEGVDGQSGERKFPDPRKPYVKNGKTIGWILPNGKTYPLSKSDTVGNDGMIYHWQDPRAHSQKKIDEDDATDAYARNLERKLFGRIFGADSDELTQQDAIRQQDREYSLAAGTEKRLELKRKADQIKEIKLEKLRNERLEDEENAFRRYEIQAQRRDEMEKIRRAYEHELKMINAEHSNNLEAVKTGNSHEIEKLNMEYAEAAKDRAERQQDRADSRRQQAAQPEQPEQPEQSEQPTKPRPNRASTKPASSSTTPAEPRPMRDMGRAQEVRPGLGKPDLPRLAKESQKKNSSLGEKKLGQLRPSLGTGHDIGRSVRKFRAQRGLDEQGMAEGQVSDDVDHRGDVDTKANIEVPGVDLKNDTFKITYNGKPYQVKIQNFSQEGLGRWQIADYDVDIINSKGKNIIDLVDWDNDRQVKMINTIIAYLDTQQAGDIQLMAWRQVGIENSTAEELYQEIQDFYKNDQQKIDKATAWLAQNIEDTEERQVFADYVKNPRSRPARTKYIPKEYLMYVAFSYSREGNTELTPGMNLKPIQLTDPDDEEEFYRKVDELFRKVQFKFDAFENKIVELADSYGLGSDPDLGSGFGQREIVWDHKMMTTSSSESNLNRQQILAQAILNFQAEVKKYVESFNNTLIKIGLPGIGEYSTWSGVLGDQLTDQQVRYFETPEGFANLAAGKVDLAKMLDDNVEKLGIQEHGGGIGPKKHWQSMMPEQMNPEDYEDEDEDLRLRSGDYVRDTQDGESGEIFRMQGDPYERRVRILDRDGRGWYIEPGRLTRVDPQDPDVQRYFGKPRQRDMDEMDKSQPSQERHGDRPLGAKGTTATPVAAKKVVKDLAMDLDQAFAKQKPVKKKGVAEGKADYNFDAEDLKRLERIRDLSTLKTQALALISRPSAKPMKPEKVEWFKNALDRMNSPIKVIKLMYDLLLSGEGHAVVGSRSSMNPNSYRQRFGEQGVEEGWSDAMLAQRTGQPRTPYAVYIKGKKWKDFENEDLARAVMNRLKAKFKADGRDPETVTIAPTDMSEGLKSTLAGAALAGAMALGGAGAAQAQSAAGGSSMPNATTIIQQIQAGKIQNQNDLSAALGDNQSIRQFVFKQLQAKAGLSGHGADSVINALAKKSTAGTQQPGAQQPVKSAGQSGVIVQRPTDNFESRIKENQDSSGVERAILNRIMVSHIDLLKQFGPDKVMQAAEEVAYNVGDVDEIGTSDVSAYVAQVKQILGATA